MLTWSPASVQTPAVCRLRGSTWPCHGIFWATMPLSAEEVQWGGPGPVSQSPKECPGWQSHTWAAVHTEMRKMTNA